MSAIRAEKLRQNGMNPSDPEPMMSLDKFAEQTGLSPVTLWRWRKAGMLNTLNICGRQYILRSEIMCFNDRASIREFAKAHITPKRLKSP